MTISETNNKTLLEIGAKKFFYKDKTGRIRSLAKQYEKQNYKNHFDSLVVSKEYTFNKNTRLKISVGQPVKIKQIIAEGEFINDIFFIDMAKAILSTLFIFLVIMVYVAGLKKPKNSKQ